MFDISRHQTFQVCLRPESKSPVRRTFHRLARSYPRPSLKVHPWYYLRRAQVSCGTTLASTYESSTREQGEETQASYSEAAPSVHAKWFSLRKSFDLAPPILVMMLFAAGRDDGRGRSATKRSPPSEKGRTSASSTLQVAGSLFVGNGLGLKKDPVAAFSGGSARHMLKKTMEDHLSSCAGG